MSLFRLLETEDRGAADQGELNDTTAVELVPAPAAGFTRFAHIWIANRSTAPAIVRVRVTVTDPGESEPADYEFYSKLLTADNPGTAAGGCFDIDCPRLDSTIKSITAILDAAATANQPGWAASWVDIPVAT